MFEKFSDRARQVVVRAQEEARALHHDYIGTEHLLLALMTVPRAMGVRALEALGAAAPRIRDRVGHYIQPGNYEPGPNVHIPFTPRAKKVLELSLREAIQLGHDIIGTEHVLLALIREADGIAGQALADLGVHLDDARREVLAWHPAEPGRPGPEPGAPQLAEDLRAEVARLRALLRRHGIDPGQDPGAESGSKPAP